MGKLAPDTHGLYIMLALDISKAYTSKVGPARSERGGQKGAMKFSKTPA